MMDRINWQPHHGDAPGYPQPQPLTVTLADLRKNGACISGYNKLVRAIQGKPFADADEERDTYIRFAHKEPVELSFILDSNGPDDALWCLRALGHESQRTCRLFAVWCARQVQHLMTDERSLAALDVAERHANGQASDQELDAARDAAWDAAWDAQSAKFREICRSGQFVPDVKQEESA